MTIKWDLINEAFGSYSAYVDQCKDTGYDQDGGWWDDATDWVFGEDFDYGTMDTSITNFYNCVAQKLIDVNVLKFYENMLLIVQFF